MTETNRIRRVLGVDPGLNVSGYGVVEFRSINQIEVVEAGVLKSGSSKDLGKRLQKLSDGIRDVITSLAPAAVAIEELYSHYQRPRTAILMGHARGVLCLAAATANLAVHHYSATQIKRVLTGNGRAPKSQMQLAVARQLNLNDVPEPPDVADALGVALCHCFLTENKSIAI